MRTPGARRSRRRGATAVEVALLLLPLMTMLVGTFEFCRYMMVRNLAENACREGARFAVSGSYDWSTADVQAIVLARMAGLEGNIAGLQISVAKVNPSTGAINGAWTDARFGEPIAVTIQGEYIPTVPRLLYMNSSIPIRCSSTMLSEAN